MNASNANQKMNWAVSTQPVSYSDAVCIMEQRVAAIYAGDASELVWLLQHPPLITAGTSSKPADLLEAERFEVFETGRGGQFTYHGPGQRVVYVMLNLANRGKDVRRFVRQLEQWLISSLGRVALDARRYDDRVGVWVDRPTGAGAMSEAKIAAIGIRVRRWVSFHGISINVCPDLSHFDAIVPCGLPDHGVTSLHDLGISLPMRDVDVILRDEFVKQFGPAQTSSAPLP